MEAINRYRLERLHFPVDGYLYIVKTITSVDGGQNFYYCGNSRYFRTEAEAAAYKAEQEGRADADNNSRSY
jgi:hypothetical protein